MVKEIISELGRVHPQALVYPLSVASKSSSHVRKSTAQALLSEMRVHSAALVDQAIVVSKELIRVSILWGELWRARLEEASRYCYAENNIPGMMSVLRPLFENLSTGGETENEMEFVRRYNIDLQEALNYLSVPQPSKQYIDRAWHKLGQIYEDLGTRLAQVYFLFFIFYL